MSDARPRICIVSPGHISSNPRVVKEADALQAAGFRVRVVSTQGNLAERREQDHKVVATRDWEWNPVGWSRDEAGERFAFWRATASHYILRKLPTAFLSIPGVAQRVAGRPYGHLRRAVASECADLFIGHYPLGLAAAAYGGRRWSAPFAFDAEDFHTGESGTQANHNGVKTSVRNIESRLLPSCAYVSASSQGIAEALVKQYSIPPPTVIHNVFPWEERTRIDGQVLDRRGPDLSIYWFSQTVGPGRGVEEAVNACGILKEGFQLHLRGTVSAEYLNHLTQLSHQLGIADKVFFHPQCPHDDVLSRAVEHDIGLAVEQPNSLNAQIAASNKLFLFFLAGLAVVATDVPGQRSIIEKTNEAGLLVPPGDSLALAARLRELRDDPAMLRELQAGSLNAARNSWNWEREEKHLISSVEQALERGTSAQRRDIRG